MVKTENIEFHWVWASLWHCLESSCLVVTWIECWVISRSFREMYSSELWLFGVQRKLERHLHLSQMNNQISRQLNRNVSKNTREKTGERMTHHSRFLHMIQPRRDVCLCEAMHQKHENRNIFNYKHFPLWFRIIFNVIYFCFVTVLVLSFL